MKSLQSGLRPVFAARLVLAATLSANYGIYGPAYELMESTPREPGSEEYRDSEKYQLRHWSLERPDSLSLLDRSRQSHPPRQSRAADRMIPCASAPSTTSRLIAYVKSDEATGNIILTVVNLDPLQRTIGMGRSGPRFLADSKPTGRIRSMIY